MKRCVLGGVALLFSGFLRFADAYPVTITVGSQDYDLFQHIVVTSPQSSIADTFKGTYKIPKLDVPVGSIEKVTVKAAYFLGVAAAGAEHCAISTKVTYDLPQPAFSETVVDEYSKLSGIVDITERNMAYFTFNLGPATFIADDPGSFVLNNSPSRTVDIPITTVGVGMGHNGATLGREYAIVAHRYFVLEVTYEMKDSYFMPASLVPANTAREFLSCSNLGTKALTVAPQGCDWWPQEVITNGSLKCDTTQLGPKRFDLKVAGLSGYKYQLKKSIDLQTFSMVEEKTGSGEAINFHVDDSLLNNSKAFYRISAEKIP